MANRSNAMSFSRSKALGCPWYFTKIYIDGVQTPDSEAASSGRMFHEWIANYVNHLAKTKQLTDWDWIDKNPVREIGYLIQLTRDYFTLTDIDFEPQTEVQFALNDRGELMGFESEDAIFRGVIDLLVIDGEDAYITDWKSGYAMKTESQIEKDRQLRRYAWAIALLRPEVQMFHVKHCYPRYRFAQVSATLTRADLTGIADELRNEMKRATEIQLMDDPPAHPCEMCVYCQLTCPLKASGLLIPPSVPVEANSIATALESLEAQKAALTDTVERYRGILAEYCGEHGDVASESGQRYGYYPVKQFRLTNEAIALILSRDPSILAPQASAVKAKLDSKKRADLKAELADCFVETAKTRFGAIKDGEE